MNPQISEDIIKLYESKYHINDSLLVQYWAWIKGVFRFDFGYSFTYQAPVVSLIKSRLLNTFILSFAAFFISWVIAVPLGTIAAYRKNTFFDKGLLLVSYFFLSLPSFLLAILFIFICAHWTSIPIGGMHSSDFDQLSYLGKFYDVVSHMIVPLIVLTCGSVSYLFRMMRANVLDVLSLDFVRILHTRGLSDRTILFKHVLRNAINPLITLLGYQLPALFSGAALIEIITGWPGLGSMMLLAVRSQDIYLVMGNMLMISLLLVIGNIMADILLAITDPRIRY
jgi:peptide/nickel transport system permease protein